MQVNKRELIAFRLTFDHDFYASVLKQAKDENVQLIFNALKNCGKEFEGKVTIADILIALRELEAALVLDTIEELEKRGFEIVVTLDGELVIVSKLSG